MSRRQLLPQALHVDGDRIRVRKDGQLLGDLGGGLLPRLKFLLGGKRVKPCVGVTRASSACSTAMDKNQNRDQPARVTELPLITSILDAENMTVIFHGPRRPRRIVSGRVSQSSP